MNSVNITIVDWFILDGDQANLASQAEKQQHAN